MNAVTIVLVLTVILGFAHEVIKPFTADQDNNESTTNENN